MFILNINQFMFVLNRCEPVLGGYKGRLLDLFKFVEKNVELSHETLYR